MVQNRPPSCWACKHFGGREARTCTAFPDGIPTPIYYEGQPHETPVDGDHGVRFEAKADPEAQQYLKLHGYR